jgi:hypothetical protein
MILFMKHRFLLIHRFLLLRIVSLERKTLVNKRCLNKNNRKLLQAPRPPTKQKHDKKVPKSEDQKKVKGTREKVKGKSALEVGRPKAEVGGRTDKPTAKG